MSFDDGFMLGLMLGEGSGGGDEPIDDWQPPADWLTVPDPAENEIYFLVEVVDDSLTNSVNFTNALLDPENGWTGQGALSIDWGDGNIYNWHGNEWRYDEVFLHTYSSTGQYLIKFTTENGKNNVFYRCPGANNILICKTGSQIVFSYKTMGQQYCNLLLGKRIKYFKHFGNTDSLPKGFARYWSGLVKIEFGEPLKKVQEMDFAGCSSLRILDTSEILTIEKDGFSQSSGLINSFPKCVEIGDDAFQYAYLSKINIPECKKLGRYALHMSRMRELSIPKCESIGEYALANCELLETADISACETLGNSAFRGDGGLSEIFVKDNCKFGEDCFKECYSLYPRPDGSIN